MVDFTLIALSSVFSSNIVSVFGFGAVSLQSEKRNFGFMLATTMCYVLSAIVVGLAYFVIEQYILTPLKAEYLKLFVVVLLSVVCAFVCKIILKAVSKEEYYLYEKSYTFCLQAAVTTGIILVFDFSASILVVMFELAMFSLGFMLIQLIFYALYEKLDSPYVLKPARNVPNMLFTLAVVSMILYSVEMFF